jgi:hypothetical protein
MKDFGHCSLAGALVGIVGFAMMCATGWAQGLSGGQQGLDGFVSKND